MIKQFGLYSSSCDFSQSRYNFRFSAPINKFREYYLIPWMSVLQATFNQYKLISNPKIFLKILKFPIFLQQLGYYKRSLNYMKMNLQKIIRFVFDVYISLRIIMKTCFLRKYFGFPSCS
jgi:hypothetical protein